MRSIDTTIPCPCGDPRGYHHCCEPLHAGATATSAGQLMRARYSAYVLQREDYLLATWHADTRPACLRLSSQRPVPRWLGLEVRAQQTIDATHATVEFIARYRLGGGPARRQHEQSRFVRVDGVWFYVDGELRA